MSAIGTPNAELIGGLLGVVPATVVGVVVVIEAVTGVAAEAGAPDPASETAVARPARTATPPAGRRRTQRGERLIQRPIEDLSNFLGGLSALRSAH